MLTALKKGNNKLQKEIPLHYQQVKQRKGNRFSYRKFKLILVHWKVPVSSKILLIGNPINRATVHYVQTEIRFKTRGTVKFLACMLVVSACDISASPL